MNDIRMIALDLDGTLLDDGGTIARENSRVLREYAGRGVVIVLASGRMTDCVSPFADMLGIDCPLLVYNGAMVRDTKEKNRDIVFHCPLESVHGDLLIEYCGRNGFHLNYYLDDVLYAQDVPSLRGYAEIYSRQTGAVFHFVRDLRRFRGRSPTKCILITDPYNEEDPTRARDYQFEHFSSLLGGEVNVVKTNPEYLEFLNGRVDKAVGLSKLAQEYGIDRESIVAFGDGENDREMLAFAGTGVAPANAKDSVKKTADIVLEETNNEAVVARYLSRFL